MSCFQVQDSLNAFMTPPASKGWVQVIGISSGTMVTWEKREKYSFPIGKDSCSHLDKANFRLSLELGSGQDSSGGSTALHPLPSISHQVTTPPCTYPGLRRGTGTGREWIGEAVATPAMR